VYIETVWARGWVLREPSEAVGLPSRGETALVCRRQRTRSSPITRSTLDSHSDLLVAAFIDLGPHGRPITC
jgi:hypothetical protein